MIYFAELPARKEAPQVRESDVPRTVLLLDSTSPSASIQMVTVLPRKPMTRKDTTLCNHLKVQFHVSNFKKLERVLSVKFPKKEMKSLVGKIEKNFFPKFAFTLFFAYCDHVDRQLC